MDRIHIGEFTTFKDQHREHQKDSLTPLSTIDKGQVSIPTGTGKTRVQIDLHVSDMIEKTKNGQQGVYLIAAHRLALCRQLLMELVELAEKVNLSFDILFIGSDKVDEDALYEKSHLRLNKGNCNVTATTSGGEVVKAVDDAKKAFRHTLIVSTYHSILRLKNLNRIDIATYDEAHTIASDRESEDNFESSIKTLQKSGIIKREYFFTATRKVSGEEYGMNNKEVYGDVLFECSPGQMIRRGEIVPPRIHRVVTADDGQFKNETMVVKTIIDSFIHHKREVQRASPLSGNLGAKLLISAEGTPAVKTIIHNQHFRVWCFQHQVRFFAFSSILGNFIIGSNGKFEEVNRNDAIDEMMKMDDSHDAILLHIDILSEGIDLPSITGVLPFRELNLIKLLQTIGRAARLLKSDRKRFYKGEYKAMEWDKMVKPYCWVIFPLLSDKTSEASKKMEKTIQQVINAYDAPKMEFSRQDEYFGEPDADAHPITEKDKSNKKDAETALQHIIEQLMIGTLKPSTKQIRDSLTAAKDKTLVL